MKSDRSKWLILKGYLKTKEEILINNWKENIYKVNTNNYLVIKVKYINNLNWKNKTKPFNKKTGINKVLKIKTKKFHGEKE